MAQDPTHRSSGGPGTGLAWLGAVVPLLFIAFAAVGYYFFVASRDAADDHPPPPAAVVVGGDYYILVRTIELYPQQPKGKAWDRLDDSGPDIAYRLSWQGNTVFESKTHNDTLIGSWDVLGLDLKDAVLGGEIDLAGSINAAIVRVQAGGELSLDVWDQDVAGKDEAGLFTFALEHLTLGDNAFEYEAAEGNAVKRLVVRVIDKSLPVEQLVNEAIQP